MRMRAPQTRLFLVNDKICDPQEQRSDAISSYDNDDKILVVIPINQERRHEKRKKLDEEFMPPGGAA